MDAAGRMAGEHLHGNAPSQKPGAHFSAPGFFEDGLHRSLQDQRASLLRLSHTSPPRLKASSAAPHSPRVGTGCTALGGGTGGRQRVASEDSAPVADAWDS